jgi:D-alanyl-D-alanine carboxypeptidase
MGHVAHASAISHKELAENFVFGSLTKLWTSSAIFKLRDAGILKLDEPAFHYMEPAYANATGHSLVERLGDRIKYVSIRELLSMRGSIPDYDELEYQLKNLRDDLGPARTAQMFGSMISDQPLGSCGVYSSMSYVLLGLVLIGQNETTWDQYEQNVWREFLPDIHFATHGTCSQYVDFSDAQCLGCKDVKVMDMSCTNGFACGNLVSTPQSVARFLWHLFEGKLLRPSTVQEMLDFTPLGRAGAIENNTSSECGHGWCQWCGYGLGVEEHANGIPFYGHAGDTYGFFSINAYDPKKRGAYVAGIASNYVDEQPNDVWWDLHDHLLQDYVVA